MKIQRVLFSHYNLSNFEIRRDVIAYLKQVPMKRTYGIAAKHARFRDTRSEVRNLPPRMTSRLILKLAVCSNYLSTILSKSLIYQAINKWIGSIIE